MTSGSPGRDHRLRDLVVRHPFGAVVLAQVRAVVAVRLVDHPAMGIGVDGQRAGVDAFGMPSSRISSSTLRVPSTLIRSAVALIASRRFCTRPAMWKTPSTPVIGVAHALLSVTSPWCTATPRSARSCALLGVA